MKKLRVELPDTLAHDVASASEPDWLAGTDEMVRVSSLDQRPMPGLVRALKAKAFLN